MKIIQISFLILTLLSCLTSFSQIEVPFFVKTANYHTKKFESGITVKAISEGNTILTLISDSKGDAVLHLPIGKQYRIELSKPGKITRFVNVDYAQLKDTIKEEDADPRGEVEISLFDDVQGVDYSFIINNPATNFTYDLNLGVYFDENLAVKTIKEVERILNIIQKARAEEQRKLEEQNQKEKEQAAIALAKKRTDDLVAKAELEAIKKAEIENQVKEKEELKRKADEEARRKSDELIAKAEETARLKKEETARKKAAADSLAALRQAQETARKKAEADSLAEVARKKVEADSLVEVARKKAEADSLAEVARKKAEADSLAEVARKKAEADSLAEVARKKAEADSLAEVARKKVEADSLAEVARKKAEADSLAEVARKKAEADSLAVVSFALSTLMICSSGAPKRNTSTSLGNVSVQKR